MELKDNLTINRSINKLDKDLWNLIGIAVGGRG